VALFQPLPGETVSEEVYVVGRANMPNFDHYVVEYGEGQDPIGWGPVSGPVDTPVDGGLLAVWDVRSLADRDYTLRVVVYDTLGNGVEMGSGAIALGPITIGDGARIGSGSVVIKPVPPGVTVVGIPGRVVTKQVQPVMDLEHGKLPDPVAEAIRLVLKEQDNLEERLKKLEVACGLLTPQDELEETRQEIEKDFVQGGGI
jgi:hypothetical protein